MGGDGRERAWQVTLGSWKTLSTGNRIGRPALRTADSDGIAAAMVPVPVLLSTRPEFHANDVGRVEELNTVPS